MIEVASPQEPVLSHYAHLTVSCGEGETTGRRRGRVTTSTKPSTGLTHNCRVDVHLIDLPAQPACAATVHRVRHARSTTRSN